jgi:GNAT superfamily N-acetyltransferase
VRPDRQRIGVGRLLMTALREAAARLGIAEIFVPSDGDDTHAHRFYESLGGSAVEVVVYSFPVAAQSPGDGGE